MSSPSARAPAQRFRERLTAPLGWWTIGIAFGVICGWLVFVATTPRIGLISVALATLVGLVLVHCYGSLTVSVDTELRVGRAHLEPEFIGSVESLDPNQYRRTLGPEAHGRAWIATRPWIDAGVRVVLADPDDPHPYWLIGSRRPERLAAAIEELRQTGRRNATGDAPQKGA